MYNEKADNVVYGITATAPAYTSYPSQGQPTAIVITQQPQYSQAGVNQEWTQSSPERAGPPTGVSCSYRITCTFSLLSFLSMLFFSGRWKDGICDCCTSKFYFSNLS